MPALPRTRRSIVLLACTLSATLLLPGALPPAAAATSPQATAALDWLAGELDASPTHLLGSTFGDDFFPDYGLTLDAVLALDLGESHPTSAAASLDAVEAVLPSYVTDRDFGPGDDRYSGPLAKGLLAAAVAGADVHDFGGFDLEAEVRARMQATGDQAGRFSDLSAGGDGSNGFGQTLAIMALSRTDDGVPAPAVAFLLAQQCPDGGFRGAYSNGTPASTVGCDDEVGSDADYTAVALSALLSVPHADGVGRAVADAIAWLLDHQDPDGGFPNLFGDVNTNTAGIAAQALRAAGSTASADAATAFVTSAQLGADESDDDPGAIAFSLAAHDTAVTDGIDDFSRGQFQRATAQGVLAFGLPLYGLAPLPPATTTTTSSTPSTSVDSTSSSTSSSVVGATSSTTAAPAGGAIPKTGAGLGRELTIAALLIAIGAAGIGGSRLRGQRRS